MTQLNLESLETRTLLAVGDVLDGEMADKVADLAGKLVEDVFNGDAEKLSDAEALAKKYLGVADASGEASTEGSADSGSDKSETKKKSKVGKLASKFEKLAGGLFDKLTGDESDEEDADTGSDHAKDTESSSKDGKSGGLFGGIKDVAEGIVDKIKGDSSGDKEGADSGSDSESDGLLDKIGDVFDKVTDLFGGLSPDQELDASHEKLSGVIGKVRDRVHAFGGTDSPAGGKVAVAAAHFLDVTSDVVDTLTGFIDDTTDSSPEKEARVEMALKVAAAALKGVSDVSSLVGAAVPGISAAAPALDAASGVLEKASGQSSKFIQGAEKVGNVIGSVGHKVAGGLEGLSNKLDPQPVANNTATAPLAEDGNSGSAGADESVVLDNEKEVLVA